MPGNWRMPYWTKSAAMCSKKKIARQAIFWLDPTPAQRLLPGGFLLRRSGAQARSFLPMPSSVASS